MAESGFSPVFSLSRGGQQESLHYGAIAVVALNGDLLASYGDPYQMAFLRSAAKPFQVMPFVLAGGLAHYGITAQELALMCASHSGTDEHVTILHDLMLKTGIRQDQLLCGVHPPFHEPTAERMQWDGEVPTPERHNCSGKHTGMLAYARMRGWDLKSYVDLQHPLQQEILVLYAEMAGMQADQLAVGIDGCSAPNWAAPLYNSALAYARLADPAGLSPAQAEACVQIAGAMRAHPDMVGGPERFDTELMRVAEGQMVTKVGADGFQAIGMAPSVLGAGAPAVGIALKIADGDARKWASHAVTLEVLRQLGALSAGQLEQLSAYGPQRAVTNWSGATVGVAEPVFTLGRA